MSRCTSGQVTHEEVHVCTCALTRLSSSISRRCGGQSATEKPAVCKPLLAQGAMRGNLLTRFTGSTGAPGIQPDIRAVEAHVEADIAADAPRGRHLVTPCSVEGVDTILGWLHIHGEHPYLPRMHRIALIKSVHGKHQREQPGWWVHRF